MRNVLMIAIILLTLMLSSCKTAHIEVDPVRADINTAAIDRMVKLT